MGALNAILVDFEEKTGLGPTYAAKLLGTSYVTYAQYRSGRRALPRYHQNHIQALLLLPGRMLERLIEEHVR